MKNGKAWLAELEAKERQATGINNLKIGFNRVFGYYIEVSKGNLSKLPEDRYQRKQTLTNAERFITPELKEKESLILGAESKAKELEYKIFTGIRDQIKDEIQRIQELAGAVAALDVLQSFATVSEQGHFVKPELTTDNHSLDIKDGWHPVVEKVMGKQSYIPNDIKMDDDLDVLLITGPNMSGKSTYMRQVALITLMAQIGCFVPADYAKISVVDQIFTRVGASDDLTAGQSTFMVEMAEVADILKHATKNSLVILDEVGRGTSTFDGISIARAVTEYITSSRTLGCKTLFATHYHELIGLENELNGVKNFSVAVKRRGDDIKFLRKIVPGGVDQSYGIEVAKLAGLPPRVITRAKELLKQMERESALHTNTATEDDGQLNFENLSRSIALDRLRKTNIDEMTDGELREFIKDLIKYI